LITAAKNKAKPAKKRNAVTKPKGEVRGISAAAAPRSLSDATRADTHDRAMPDRLRIGLVALAALVLVVVLLVPRGPAALFSHGVDEDGYPRRARLRRRAAVAIMPGAGRRHS
jgi:hypothetical protein